MRKISEYKCIVITGAGGSIGKALVHRLAKSYPDLEIHAVDYDDSRLALLQAELGDRLGDACVHLADIRFKDDITELIEKISPDIIIHAAALKQVPLLEAHPQMAYRTNVVGTQHIITAAEKVGARPYLISTDKAVDAVSVMGQTKAKAELHTLGYQHGRVIRLPNIMWTRGALKDLVLQRHRFGQPVTLTSEEMTRWWLTMEEGVTFICDCIETAPPGSICVPLHAREISVRKVLNEICESAGIDVGDILLTKPRYGERLKEFLWNASREKPKHNGDIGLIETR